MRPMEDIVGWGSALSCHRFGTINTGKDGGCAPLKQTMKCKEFEWHEDERLKNLAQHKIDFESVPPLFDNPYLSDEIGSLRRRALHRPWHC